MFPNLEIVKAKCDVGGTGSGLDRNRPNLCSRSFVEAMEDIKRPLAAGFVTFKMDPKICSNCGRVMERNMEEDRFECVCGNDEPVYYGREEDY